MKLESLTSEKLEPLTNNQMSKIRGAGNVATNSGIFMNNGHPEFSSHDVNVYNDSTGQLLTQVFWGEDGTKHVISVTLGK
ncbi:hypothetical protein SAMN05421841_0851 [Chryseobacterium wanjuense]|uniref:Uncharacterized protein n=1 Tax=Chryseobacterium wanjuense TaxID=356305 RepID=A0A1I0NWW2_9FLAO|nr:hypothetical protein [Chryseobacterium wanjuense]SEW06255.1 hypothetical protein SAMN05421841_0851 [Chryseobacterium wanjuense]